MPRLVSGSRSGSCRLACRAPAPRPLRRASAAVRQSSTAGRRALGVEPAQAARQALDQTDGELFVGRPVAVFGRRARYEMPCRCRLSHRSPRPPATRRPEVARQERPPAVIVRRECGLTLPSSWVAHGRPTTMATNPMASTMAKHEQRATWAAFGEVRYCYRPSGGGIFHGAEICPRPTGARYHMVFPAPKSSRCASRSASGAGTRPYSASGLVRADHWSSRKNSTYSLRPGTTSRCAFLT